MDAPPVVTVGAGTFLGELEALVDQMHSALLVHAEGDPVGVDFVGRFFQLHFYREQIKFYY